MPATDPRELSARDDEAVFLVTQPPPSSPQKCCGHENPPCTGDMQSCPASGCTHVLCQRHRLVFRQGPFDTDWPRPASMADYCCEHCPGAPPPAPPTMCCLGPNNCSTQLGPCPGQECSHLVCSQHMRLFEVGCISQCCDECTPNTDLARLERAEAAGAAILVPPRLAPTPSEGTTSYTLSPLDIYLRDCAEHFEDSTMDAPAAAMSACPSFEGMPWANPSEDAKRTARETWGCSSVTTRAETVRTAIDRRDLPVLRALFSDANPEGLGRRRYYQDYQPNRQLKHLHLRIIVARAIAQLPQNPPDAWAFFQIAQAMVGDGAPIDENNCADKTPLWLMVLAIRKVPEEWISWFLQRGADPNFTPQGAKPVASLGDDEQRQRFHQLVQQNSHISLPNASPSRPDPPNFYMDTMWSDGQWVFCCKVCPGVRRFATAEAANNHVRDTDHDGTGLAPASRVERMQRVEHRRQELVQEEEDRKQAWAR